MEIGVTVKFDQRLQGCFLNLSKGLLQILQKNQTLAFSIAGSTENVPLVLRVKCPNGKFVAMSWSGGIVCQNTDALLISLSPRFANSIGICRDEEVTVSMLEKIHCAQSVIISPLHQGDWELLELNVRHLELNLLNQVRVMFAGLQFPAVVSGSSVLLRVESSVPSGYVYLTEGTVLEIVPAQHKRNAEPAPDSAIGSRPLKRLSPEAKSRKFLGHATFEWMCAKVGNVFSRYQGLQDSHIFSSRLEPSKNGHVGAAAPVAVARRSDVIGAKSEDILKHVDLVLRSQPILNCSPEIEVVCGDEANLSQGCRRCQSVPYGGSTGASQVCIGRFSRCRPPYQAYVCAASLSVLDCLNFPVVSFCAEVSVVLTPSQLVEQNKEKSTSKDSLRLGLNVTVLPKPDWLTVCGPNWDAVVALHPIVMEQLGVATGSCVRLQCCHRHVEDVGAVLLHIPTTREEFAAKVEAAFSCYLYRCVDMCGSVLLNQGTLLHFVVAGQSCPAILELIDVRNEIFGVVKRSDAGRLAIVSSADEDADSFAKEKYSLCSEPRVSKSDLGGIADVWTKLCSLVESSLFCECCTARSHGSRRVLNCSRAVLLHGGSDNAAGCGKTSVARALCGHFQKEPYFVHAEFVDCTSLRGKKIETIEGRWEVMYEELAWKQPSLVVFDDVHQLCSRVDAAQDGGALALYSNRLVLVFLAFVTRIIRRNDRIFVLATASCVDALHADLVSGTSAGLFQEVICLSFQCDAQVYEVLQCAMRDTKGFCLNPSSSSAVASRSIDSSFTKSFTFDLLDDDIRIFAKMLRNCLPSDIKGLLCRTVHFAANSEDASNPVAIRKEHFSAALEEFKPHSVSGLHLHKPDPVSWSVVGGLHSVKATLQEAFLWPSKYPELFSKFPLRLRSGVLLYGAPGTGKTLLASAVAHGCGLNFISVKGPELLSKYVGSSEHNVRELFVRAQSAKPCIVFFDEFDSLAPRRGHDNTGVTDRVVNQLLTQLDGVEALDGVFVLGATSRPDLIDPALLRPGRLDRCLYCPMPSAADRLEILTIYARSLTLADVLDMTWLAEATEHFSGADLKALLYSAQVMAINEMLSLQKAQSDASDVTITKHHLTEALKTSHPSVSSLERARFEKIFNSFESSRKSSTYSSQRKSLQKVTFA